MFYGDGFFMGGMHGLWWIFWILVICCVIVFLAWGRSDAQRHPPSETPRQVLQHRLASGEITPEEYETRKALLDRDAGSSA